MRLTRRRSCFATPGRNVSGGNDNQIRTTMTSTNEEGTMSGKQGDERWIGRLRVIGWTAVAIILLLPAIAMQLTDEVDWSAGDFMAAGVLLIGTGLLAELVVRRTRDNAYRAGAAIALFATLLLAWSNAAVGFVGSGGNTANILYVALLAVVLAGGFVAGFAAPGMAKAMVAAAVGQGLVMVLAFASDLVGPEETGIILFMNLFFVALWSAAAVLFRKAARRGA